MGPPWGAFCQITLTSCFPYQTVWHHYDRDLPNGDVECPLSLCRSSETARRHSGVSARWVNGTGTNRLTDRPGITRNAASYREGPHIKSKLSRFMKLNYAWSYIIMNWLTHIQTAETCCGEKNITRQKKGDRNNAQFFYDAQMRHFLRQHVVYTQLQMAVTSISPLNLSIIFLSPPALMT